MVIMLWKYVKNLSPRSELWNLWWALFVKKWKTNNLEEFYNDSNFKNRVKTFFDKNSEHIRYCFEEWNELNRKDKESIKKLAMVLAWLYNNITSVISIEEYIEKAYKKRINNMPKSIWDFPEYQQKIINDYFLKFKNNAWKSIVILSRIHGDLKPDNVIINWDNLTIIDWEWCKKWSYIQDIQRLALCLDEEGRNIFLSEIRKNLKHKESDSKKLYLFHEFLLLILWLSKDKIDFNDFISILKRDGIDDI